MCCMLYCVDKLTFHSSFGYVPLKIDSDYILQPNTVIQMKDKTDLLGKIPLIFPKF